MLSYFDRSGPHCKTLINLAMSRSLTAAQVIALGEYLDPDFDPSSLTVNQLLGVFGFHNIRYPTPYTKPKLVQLFNDEIKPKMRLLKKDRVKKENSIASDNGIKDGATGRYLNEDSNKVGSLLPRCLHASRLVSRPAPTPVLPPRLPSSRIRHRAQSRGGTSRHIASMTRLVAF